MKHRPDERPLEQKRAWTVEEARVAIDERRGFVEDPKTGCWLTPSEYRALTGFSPRMLSVYEATYGPVPPGWQVAHRCTGGRFGCIRPSHLDIMQDGSEIATPGGGLPALVEIGFGQRLRDERDARHATDAQFARELGVAVSTLRSWEAGSSTPGVDELRRIARKLGWNGRRRKWIVTVVVQQFVVETSAGAASRAVINDLEHEEGDRHLAVYNVIAADDVPRLRRTHKTRKPRRGIPTVERVLTDKKGPRP